MKYCYHCGKQKDDCKCLDEHLKKQSMSENDIILEEGDEEQEYYPDYNGYIVAAFNALQAVDGFNEMVESDSRKISAIRKKSLDLIYKSLNELSKQFDAEHA